MYYVSEDGLTKLHKLGCQNIYLATPYTGTLEEQDNRYDVANDVCISLLLGGFHVFSPITHSHVLHNLMAKRGRLPKNHFWYRKDLPFLEWADTVLIICTDGWDRSTGVAMEMAVAKYAKKAVLYLMTRDDIGKDVKLEVFHESSIGVQS